MEGRREEYCSKQKGRLECVVTAAAEEAAAATSSDSNAAPPSPDITPANAAIKTCDVQLSQI